jgi:hypothetical protein
MKSFFEANVRWTNKIWERLEKIDRKTFDTLIRSDNFMKTWRYIEEEIFRL